MFVLDCLLLYLCFLTVVSSQALDQFRFEVNASDTDDLLLRSHILTASPCLSHTSMQVPDGKKIRRISIQGALRALQSTTMTFKDLPFESHLHQTHIVPLLGEETILAHEVHEPLRQGELLLPGTQDRDGATIIIYDAAQHAASGFSTQQTLRAVLYLMELALREEGAMRKGFTVVR